MATIDDYQGEESDIVIVSFVRSNARKSMGFLKTPNRVCVALSRARKGLFCFGNFSMYARSSLLWNGIIRSVIAQNSLLDAMRIRWVSIVELPL